MCLIKDDLIHFSSSSLGASEQIRMHNASRLQRKQRGGADKHGGADLGAGGAAAERLGRGGEHRHGRGVAAGGRGRRVAGGARLGAEAERLLRDAGGHRLRAGAVGRVGQRRVDAVELSIVFVREGAM